MVNRNQQIVNKIYNEIEIISSLLSGFDYVMFSNDERTKRAVCMTLINIGELVKMLTDDFKSTHCDIPWRAIAGLRDVAAHHYQSLRMEDIWATIKTDIPVLYAKIDKLK